MKSWKHNEKSLASICQILIPSPALFDIGTTRRTQQYHSANIAKSPQGHSNSHLGIPLHEKKKKKFTVTETDLL